MSDLAQPSPNTPKPKGKGKCLIFGCLGVTAVIFVVLAAGAYWFFTSGKALIADTIQDSIVEEIEKSGLPEDQQTALTVEIERVTEGVKSGEIGIAELKRFGEEMESSPILATMFLYGAQDEIQEKANLDNEEKRTAARDIRRFVYGVFEDRIPESAVDEILLPLLKDRDRSKMEFRSDISSDEIQAALAKAKAYADGAGIANEGISPDLAREVKEIIDRILEAE